MTYSDYLIESIGSPPDTAAAKKLVAKLDFDISIKSKDISWSSAPQLQPLSYFQEFSRKSGRAYNWRRGEFFLLREDAGTSYLFTGSFWQPGAVREEFMLLLALAISGIIAASYFTIKRIFRPIHLLNTGVEKIAGGDLEHTIPVQSPDELGRLSTSFNHMAGQVRRMINSREQLLLDVSHEMRSPLTRMKLGLELLDDKQRKESLSEDISEIEKMISEILEAERLNSPNGGLKLKSTNLADLMRSVAADFDSLSPGIQTAYLPEECIVFIDPERIQMVIRNLVENAFKYSSSATKPVHLSLTQTAGHVFLIIKDFGEGIPAEDLPHIFDPFYRVDKSRSRETGGYGLGMSICKNIVEAHSGKIEIESTVGIGTTVTLSLPTEQ